MSANVQQFEHSLALPFFGIEMKTDLFQSCGRCWVFQICWHIECSTFSSVVQLCPNLCDPTDCSMPGFLVHHQLPKLTQTHVHWVSDVIQPSHFNSIIFRIWNSSAGTPSPPPALFIVMLPKAHLTSHSRMSGSKWVTTPLRLSRSLRPFLYNSSVSSGHLLLMSSASVFS